MIAQFRRRTSSYSLTQQALADQIGVTRQTVNAIEGDEYSPSLGVCRRIPSSARERAVLGQARTAKQAISVYIVDTAGRSPVVKQAVRSQIGFSDRLLEVAFRIAHAFNKPLEEVFQHVSDPE